MFCINSVNPLQKIVKPNYIIAKADSGASSHCFKESDTDTLQSIEKDNNRPTLLLPNLQTITANQKGYLPLNLSKKVTKTNILDEKDLRNASLIFLGQLCDDDCKVYLDKRKLIVYKNNKKILHGSRNYSDGLWDVHFPTNDVTEHYTKKALGQQQTNIIIHKDKTQQELAA